MLDRVKTKLVFPLQQFVGAVPGTRICRPRRTEERGSVCSGGWIRPWHERRLRGEGCCLAVLFPPRLLHPIFWMWLFLLLLSRPAGPARLVPALLLVHGGLNVVRLRHLQLAPEQSDILPGAVLARLGVVVQGHANSAAVVAVILPDDLLTMQFPEASIMVAAGRDEVGAVGAESTVPYPPLVAC